MRTAVCLLLTALALAAQQPAPRLQISANGSRRIELPRGWPLLVRGFLTPAATGGDPVRLAPAAMAWFDAIRFDVTSSSGAQPGWNFKLPAQPEEREITLAPGGNTVLEWFLDPEAAASLTEGTYTLTATLEIKSGAGWTGWVRSVPVEIRVMPEPETLSPEQQAARALLRTRAALLNGRSQEAEAEIDGLLKAQPASILGLQAKARLLARRGLAPLGLVYALRALAQFTEQYPDAEEPPAGLYDLVSRLRRAKAKPETATSVPRKE
jgi:hypothetical protein